MASTEFVTLTDDLDNTITEGVQTVSFFDPETGDKVELELGEKNARALVKVIAGLEKYLIVARVVKPPVAVKATAKPSNLTKVREWAQANGYAVGDRGRIKAEILEAYDKSVTPDVQNRTEAGYLDPKLEAIDKEFQAEADAALDVKTKAAVESDSDTRPATEEELQDMLVQMAVSGTEPTLANLQTQE